MVLAKPHLSARFMLRLPASKSRRAATLCRPNRMNGAQLSIKHVSSAYFEFRWYQKRKGAGVSKFHVFGYAKDVECVFVRRRVAWNVTKKGDCAGFVCNILVCAVIRNKCYNFEVYPHSGGMYMTQFHSAMLLLLPVVGGCSLLACCREIFDKNHVQCFQTSIFLIPVLT